MRILFLGSATSREQVRYLSGGSIAGNKMQVNVLENLNKYEDVDIKALTVLSVAPFPKDKAFYIRKKQLVISEGLTAIQVPFVNIPIIKQIWQMTSVYLEARKIIKSEDIDLVFSFNLFPQVGVPLTKVQKKFNLPTISLLADLPIDDNYNRKGIGVVLRKCFDYLTLSAIAKCKTLLVLNKNAINQYAPHARYRVIEGGVDNEEIQIDRVDYSSKNKKNIIYSGALTEYSGVLNLINAMTKIQDKTLVLDIYGGGLLESYIKRKAEELPNVNFFGSVDNATMRKLQREAYLLVNPRPIDDPISKVTFPSKIFEYMISGTATLTTKLNGFTEDYLDKMFMIESNDPIEIAAKIDEIMKMDPLLLEDKASKALNFIKENKTWEKQSIRIYDFFKKIVAEK
ncbi:glycosyltransferase [Bacillus timonensis]|nr:glycosyltransferase [Bacillus timonensis]